MEDLNITIVQSALHWEDIDKNLKMFEDKLQGINKPADLIILPEMFSTGFTMNAGPLAEGMEGKTVNWMKEQSEKNDAVITGSIIIEDKGNYYNRLVWMQPDGRFETYDKRHLFTLAKEQKVFSAGDKRLITNIKGWRICPQVCYDLRFPVWNRNRNDYDCIIFVANWPERRRNAWRVLLKARAIENQSYTIGVNRVGEDGNKVYYSGDSVALRPNGEYLIEASHEEAVHTVVLSSEYLYRFRRKFQFLPDADEFSIKDEQG